MSIKYPIILLLLCMSMPTLEIKGQSMAFLDANIDAGSWGVGNGYVIREADFATIYSNVAMISFALNKGAVGVSYMPWMRNMISGSSLQSLSGYYRYNQHGFGGGVRFFRGPEIKQTDINGISLKPLRMKEYALDVAYSYGLSRCFALAISLHYLRSGMGQYKDIKSGSAIAIAIDLLVKKHNWSLGLSMKNWGTEIGYGYGNYELPAELRLGATYRFLCHPLHTINSYGSVEYRVLPTDYSGLEASCGVEYSYNQLVALRCGYHYGDKKHTGPSYITLGGGINMFNISLNTAYVVMNRQNPLQNTFIISTSWRF